MVDISHVSDKTFWDALEVSRAPMIASHSSCRSISGHPRNMTDEMIKALAAKGGVIQINYLDSFIDPELYAWTQKTQAARRDLMLQFQNEPRETAICPKSAKSWSDSLAPRQRSVGRASSST
ncbi:MAG: membrane dipeptidase [Acidobacteria bacterium]|nr:membrane dipeptidase [Acidobacteriota bacterium]